MECVLMIEYDWTKWTPWTELLRLDLAGVPNAPGAYVIAAGRSIARAVGTDDEGFLDIGESGKLQDRLWGFRECVTVPKTEWHRAGWRFAFFGFDKHFPVPSLRVRWIGTGTKAEAVRVEGQVMLAYLRRHCELPPLNYQFNWAPFEEDGWDLLERLEGRG